MSTLSDTNMTTSAWWPTHHHHGSSRGHHGHHIDDDTIVDLPTLVATTTTTTIVPDTQFPAYPPYQDHGSHQSKQAFDHVFVQDLIPVLTPVDHSTTMVIPLSPSPLVTATISDSSSHDSSTDPLDVLQHDFGNLHEVIPPLSAIASLPPVLPPSPSSTPLATPSQASSTTPITAATIVPAVVTTPAPTRPPARSRTGGALPPSCAICHGQKVKCDGLRPCSRCIRLNRPHQCLDRCRGEPVVRTRRRRRASATAAPPPLIFSGGTTTAPNTTTTTNTTALPTAIASPSPVVSTVITPMPVTPSIITAIPIPTPTTVTVTRGRAASTKANSVKAPSKTASTIVQATTRARGGSVDAAPSYAIHNHVDADVASPSSSSTSSGGSPQQSSSFPPSTIAEYVADTTPTASECHVDADGTCDVDATPLPLNGGRLKHGRTTTISPAPLSPQPFQLHNPVDATENMRRSASRSPLRKRRPGANHTSNNEVDSAPLTSCTTSCTSVAVIPSSSTSQWLQHMISTFGSVPAGVTLSFNEEHITRIAMQRLMPWLHHACGKYGPQASGPRWEARLKVAVPIRICPNCVSPSRPCMSCAMGSQATDHASTFSSWLNASFYALLWLPKKVYITPSQRFEAISTAGFCWTLQIGSRPTSLSVPKLISHHQKMLISLFPTSSIGSQLSAAPMGGMFPPSSVLGSIADEKDQFEDCRDPDCDAEEVRTGTGLSRESMIRMEKILASPPRTPPSTSHAAVAASSSSSSLSTSLPVTSSPKGYLARVSSPRSDGEMGPPTLIVDQPTISPVTRAERLVMEDPELKHAITVATELNRTAYHAPASPTGPVLVSPQELSSLQEQAANVTSPPSPPRYPYHAAFEAKINDPLHESHPRSHVLRIFDDLFPLEDMKPAASTTNALITTTRATVSYFTYALSTNDALTRVLGYTKEELALRLQSIGWRQHILFVDPGQACMLYQFLSAGLIGIKDHFSMEALVLSKWGTVIPCYVCASMRISNGFRTFAIFFVPLESHTSAPFPASSF